MFPQQPGLNNFNTLTSGYDHQSFKPAPSFLPGFNGVNSGYIGAPKPVFEGGNTFDGSTGFGADFGHLNSPGFHSTNPDLYKKALKGVSDINSVNSYNGLYSSGSTNYNQYQTPRQDSFDCVCVPFNQCPVQDILGRKGDLILPLDPRNLRSNIEAFSDASNSTRTKHVHRREVSQQQSNDIKKTGGEAVSISTNFVYYFHEI